MTEEINEKDAAIADIQGQLLSYIEGQVANEPDFAGVVFDEIQNSEGRLLGLRVVFCDVVGENVARRV